MQTLTTNQAIAAGGVLGGMLATFGIFILAVYILFIIAWWKLFTKAGEKGWKSLIPIYNVYVYCRIIDINFWIYAFGIPFALGLLSGIAGTGATNGQPSTFALIVSFISLGYAIFFAIYEAIKLGNAFKKGTGFKVGLVLLPNIFLLILAFGSSKYTKPVKK
ncbi:hypothetical protein IKE71_03035 [Candidatus Saccharibacteria bacterium]|nr:hypothetical protein [Candidatus Saccharibacteria bacterium]